MAASPPPGGHLDDPSAVAGAIDGGGVPPRDEPDTLHVLDSDMPEVLERARARA